MAIYTKTGDAGKTGLLNGERVSKDNPSIEACGALDELNAFLGMVKVNCSDAVPECVSVLEASQQSLITLSSRVSMFGEPSKKPLSSLSPEMVQLLENAIDLMDAQLAPLNGFVLPGKTAQEAWVHLARTVCRRTERQLVFIVFQIENAKVDFQNELAFLNRLSDYLFVLARYLLHKTQPQTDNVAEM